MKKAAGVKVGGSDLPAERAARFGQHAVTLMAEGRGDSAKAAAMIAARAGRAALGEPCGAPDYFAPGIMCKLPAGHEGFHCGDNCPDGTCNTCEPRR